MKRRNPQAVVFDLDGVLVDTARLHGRAWKRAFDRFFDERGIDDEFDETADYRDHVDGRPRYEGVASFLSSRGIELPEGDASDPPGFQTVASVGNYKNQLFHELIDSEGVDVLPGADALVEALAERGTPMAIVSSSRNAEQVLPEELGRHIEVVLGGADVEELDMPGKPAPDMFIEGARQLGFDPGSAAVVEDATAGVHAGRVGGFAITVGIDPEGSSGLRSAGADVVVSGVGDLPVDVGSWSGLLASPPNALESLDQIGENLEPGPAVFLDYDGVLTPIVDDPSAATIGDEERGILKTLADLVPVAIVSGRGLDDVKSLVAVEGLTYSGSHGFEIEMPDGERVHQDDAARALPALDRAEGLLVEGTEGLGGVVVERKPYAIAIHTRRADSEEARIAAGELARRVVEEFSDLILRGGKEIHELRPALDWDKGAAVSHLLGLLPGDPVPLYLGDDDTDEDGFLACRREGGVGILVGSAEGSETWADYTLSDPDEAIRFLTDLTGSLS